MNLKTLSAASCLIGLALHSNAQPAELVLPPDGWASWQIEAVEGAPDWCCWSSWDNREGSRTACRLDDRGNSATHDRTTIDAMRVYARVAAGKVERVRVLSATCPVQNETAIHDIGNVATDDSARWLLALAKRAGESTKHDDLGENALAALATHRGEVAQNALVTMARDDGRADGRAESRKMAIFWLAQMRGIAGAAVVTSVMFNDRDAEVRKHGAFAITQSKSNTMARDLISLGNTDKVPDVRAQAWFWLSQAGAEESEEAISAALRNDADDHVREQAIFALSQLPGERATLALIKVAEDRSLSREQRKRAVFWLAQSKSDGAQKYLEKVLAVSASR
jgi:hypothetical protein